MFPPCFVLLLFCFCFFAIPLSRSDAAAMLQRIAKNISHSTLNTSRGQNYRQHHLNELRRLQIPSGLRRREATLLCRLWLRVAFTKSYSFRIGMADNALCDACGTEETLQHIFCDCPCYAAQRRSLIFALARLHNRPLTLETILQCHPDNSSRIQATKALLKFLRTTDLHERL